METGKEERGQVEQASVTEDEQKEKEATAVDDGEVEGEATTVAEQQDQEQDHTEEKLDSGVCVYSICVYGYVCRQVS